MSEAIRLDKLRDLRAQLSSLGQTPPEGGGEAWWHSAKDVGFIPRFVVDVDALLARHSGASVVLNEKA